MLGTNVYTVVNEHMKDQYALLNKINAPNSQGPINPHWEKPDSVNEFSDSYVCKWELAVVED